MADQLPNDLLTFLRAGRQLDYDVDNSEVGRIVLKRDTDLVPTTITTFPGCQSITWDPYIGLEGLYQIEVYDLVAESERYDTEGLFCWIVALRCFGCVDPEHGDVLTFPGVSWTDITQDPQPYLDAQWGSYDVGVRALPWLHFPFKLRDSETVIPPYGSHCPVHQTALIVGPAQNPPLFDVLRERTMAEWLRRYVTVFPCAGVPANDDEMLHCPVCRAAQEQWVAKIDNAIERLDAKPNAHGWVQCPGCGIRFSVTDPNAFSDGRCLTCAQKINLIT